MKKINLFILILFTTITINAANTIKKTKWKLVNSELNTTTESPYIYFDINSSKVSGFSGCNRFSGAYSVQNSTIKFSPFASTRMMCPKNQMNSEMRFFKVIASVVYYEQNKNNLLFFNKEEKVVLKFSKVE